jgi:hypothetical protein
MLKGFTLGRMTLLALLRALGQWATVEVEEGIARLRARPLLREQPLG